jgi:thiamine biosynthesis protein ThiI
MAYLQRSVIVRVHEIALKGDNRSFFFNKLIGNIRIALQGIPIERVRKLHMGVEVVLANDESWLEVRDRLKNVFGLVKFYRCYKLPPNMDNIKAFLSSQIPRLNFNTFRISARRGNKQFPMTSVKINEELGYFIKELSGAKVDLNRPELNIHVELQHGEALIYYMEEQGLGGLPVGTGGKVLALLSGGIDSPVAAWRMMKRGCQVAFVHFHSFPIVEGTSREKARELADILNLYQYRSTLLLVPFGEVQSEIILSVPPVYRIIMYRRFMARIAEAIAIKLDAKAIITGESLGQVGSQTLENLVTVRSAINMPVLSPLIGMDKQEIIEEARRIDTFDVSIIPDEDCCSLFVPKHPATRSTPEELEILESTLDIDELVDKALLGIETFEFSNS